MSIEIEIEKDLLKKLKTISAKKKMDPEEYILDLLKKSLAIEDLNRIRKKLKGVAEKAGYKSEEDILRDIS